MFDESLSTDFQAPRDNGGDEDPTDVDSDDEYLLVLGQMAEQETPRNQLLTSLVEQCDGHVALSEEGFNNWMARRNRPARIVPRRKAR